MGVQTTSVSEPTDTLDMSDEDFMDLPLPEDEDLGSEENTEELEANDDGSSEEGDEDPEEGSDDAGEVDPEGLEEGLEDDTVEGDTDGSEEDKDPEVDSDDEIDDTSEKDVEVLPESLRTFKANGKDVTIDNVEDALQLMQMGANYGKKMKGLAPNLRMMKMLDNNGLLSEDKINRLIDLDKKDPAAIAQLIKDSGIDPLELGGEGKDSTYQPKTYNVGDSEVELDAALDDISGTSSYQETLSVISTKWDESSRSAIVADPSIIGTINAHIDNGTFAQVTKVIDKERMLGRLNGVSDIEAYQLIGNQMQEKGQFAGQQQPAPENTRAEVKKKIVGKKAVDPKVLKDRKRAASSTKSSPGSTKKDSYDPLDMSDEDFMKLGNKF